MTRTEELLRDLIALPSVNPAFLPPRDPLAGEGRVAEFLASIAAKAGLDIDFQEALPGRPNIIVRLIPSGTVRQRVLLAPHLDTVPAENEQFEPRIRNGRMYGRGACDTKGSVAAMLGAMLALARQGSRPRHTELVFVGLVDEENVQAGSRAFVQDGGRANLAIVGEATRLKVVTAHKGSLWLLLETEGRSAHGARPELGRNAIHAMARVVDTLETEYAAQLRKRRHPLLGHPTVSVGTIHGGSQVNIVPDRCTISVDRRTIPGEGFSSVTKEIKALLAKKQLDVTVTYRKQEACFPLETSPDLHLVQLFLASAKQDQPAGVHYFCDASILSRGGIPSVVFGPGDIAQAHTANEWISLASLRKAEAMLLQFFATLP